MSTCEVSLMIKVAAWAHHRDDVFRITKGSCSGTTQVWAAEPGGTQSGLSFTSRPQSVPQTSISLSVAPIQQLLYG